MYVYVYYYKVNNAHKIRYNTATFMQAIAGIFLTQGTILFYFIY